MNHGRELNRRIREAGVIWHQCSGCGLDWPFPKGSPDERDWICAVCVNAQVARATRDMVYYSHAVDLVSDELESLAPDRLDDRRAKIIAILRMSAHWIRQLPLETT